jgi:hypothetical protein
LHALLNGLQHVPGVKAAKEATVLGSALQPSASTEAMCLIARISLSGGALRQAVAMGADDKTIDGCRRELKSVCPDLEHVRQDHLRDIINVAAAQFNTGFRGDVGVLKHFFKEVGAHAEQHSGAVDLAVVYAKQIEITQRLPAQAQAQPQSARQVAWPWGSSGSTARARGKRPAASATAVPRKQVCRDFADGRCSYGTQCKFAHSAGKAEQNAP